MQVLLIRRGRWKQSSTNNTTQLKTIPLLNYYYTRCLATQLTNALNPFHTVAFERVGWVRRTIEYYIPTRQLVYRIHQH